MAGVFDFSKEYGDYKQRVALVYKALFENEFLENFYLIIEELFSGNYLLSSLRRAVEKNGKSIFDNTNEVKPIIKKENATKFTDSLEKSLVLMFLLGEVCFELESKKEPFDIERELTIISDTIITIESERRVYLSKIGESALKSREIENINVQLAEMDNLFVKRCKQLKKYLQDRVLRLPIEENERELSKDIINVVSSITQERELERKFLRKDKSRIM